MYIISSSDKIKRCPCCGNKYPIEIRDNNTVYVHCSHCGFKTKEYYYTDKQKAIDEWNNSVSPWHTGTPTEEGCFYALQCKGYMHPEPYFGVVVDGVFSAINWEGDLMPLPPDLIAWQKIEPYREKEDVGTK